MSKSAQVANYEVTTTFRAPLRFVYRWCTDFTPQDPDYTGEGFARSIVRRTPTIVVLEDLYETPHGWTWLRRVIRLRPPAAWRADTLGSDRAISVEYSLSELADHRTRLTIRARRRPHGIGTANPSNSAWERSIGVNWRKFGAALEGDYRRSLRRSPSSRRQASI